MGIQIFGTKKCFDTKKAERFFKERGVPFQRIDLLEKGLSRGEFASVCQAVGGLENLLDPSCRDRNTYTLVQYLTPDAKADKAFENQQILKTPIVRSGRRATVGFCPDVWTQWLREG